MFLEGVRCCWEGVRQYGECIRLCGFGKVFDGVKTVFDGPRIRKVLDGIGMVSIGDPKV